MLRALRNTRQRYILFNCIHHIRLIDQVPRFANAGQDHKAMFKDPREKDGITIIIVDNYIFAARLETRAICKFIYFFLIPVSSFLLAYII